MIESISELRKICQKKYSVTPSLEIVYRTVSIYFTRLFLHTSISPNQVTMLSFFLGLAGVILISFTNVLASLVGMGCLLLWTTLDCVDGEIARYRKVSSVTGLYLDRLNGSMISPMVFLGLALRVYRTFHNGAVFIFGFSASFAALLYTLSAYNVYASAVDVYSQSYKLDTRGGKEKVCSNIVGIGRLHNQVQSMGSFIYNLVCYILPGGGMSLIIPILFIVDLFFPQIEVGTFIFNSFYLYLIVYGILMPFVWLGIVFLIIKDRSPERLLSFLLEINREDK